MSRKPGGNEWIIKGIRSYYIWGGKGKVLGPFPKSKTRPKAEDERSDGGEGGARVTPGGKKS